MAWEVLPGCCFHAATVKGHKWSGILESGRDSRRGVSGLPAMRECLNVVLKIYFDHIRKQSTDVMLFAMSQATFDILNIYIVQLCFKL